MWLHRRSQNDLQCVQPQTHHLKACIVVVVVPLSLSSADVCLHMLEHVSVMGVNVTAAGLREQNKSSSVSVPVCLTCVRQL